MKTLSKLEFQSPEPTTGSNPSFDFFLNTTFLQKRAKRSGFITSFSHPRTNPVSLLTAEAITEISCGGIPDLEKLCNELYRTLFQTGISFSALQFIPVLQALNAFRPEEIERFLENPTTNHVLVQNNLLKVVLIHWTPGTMGRIHGHAQGGCVFKVLHGRMEEKRYTPDARQDLLSDGTFQSGSIAYIDDRMAYHAVGNPFEESAISLHVYTTGKQAISSGSSNLH